MILDAFYNKAAPLNNTFAFNSNSRAPCLSSKALGALFHCLQACLKLAFSYHRTLNERQLAIHHILHTLGPC